MSIGAVLDNSYDILSRNQFKRSRSMDELDKLKPHADPVRGFADSLDVYTEFLDSLDSQYLWFLTDLERIKLQKKLRFIYLLISAQIKFEAENSRYQEISSLISLRKKCFLLLSDIRKIERKLDCPIDEISADSHPILPKRVFMCVNAWTMDEIAALKESPSAFTRDWMGTLNERRLYWVWGGSMLYSFMGIDGIRYHSHVHFDQADFILSNFSRITGALSWILYLSRFTLNMSIVLKHTIPSSLWMSHEELLACRDTWFYQRFVTHFKKRYAQILNDLIWGIANFCCANLLRGSIRLNASNDLLTFVLLVFDLFMRTLELILAIKRFNEEYKKISNEILQIEHKYSINSITSELYKEKREILESARTKLSHDWRFEKKRLLTEVGYAFFLCAAFFAMTMPFIPLPSLPLIILGVSGAIICHFSAIVLNLIHLRINLKQKQAKMNEYTDKINDCFTQLNNHDAHILTKKKAYLEMRTFEAQYAFIKAQKKYEIIQAVRYTLFDSIIPFVVFGCLALAPIGIGIPLLLLGGAVMIGSQLIIKGKYEPTGPKRIMYHEQAFEITSRFCKTKDHVTPSILHGFFKKTDQKLIKNIAKTKSFACS